MTAGMYPSATDQTGTTFQDLSTQTDETLDFVPHFLQRSCVQGQYGEFCYSDYSTYEHVRIVLKKNNLSLKSTFVKLFKPAETDKLK